MKYFPSPFSLLVTSMGLNLALAAGMVWSWCREPEARAATAPMQAPRPAPAPQKAASTFSKKQPFHWKELESPDFATFIQNLRGIGCPEPTIRDIVSGELTDIYEQKLQELTMNSDGRTGSVGGPRHAAELQALQSRLKEEKSRLLGTLLASSPAQPSGLKMTDTSSTQPVQTTTATDMATHAAAMIPAAFMVGNAPGQNNNPQVLSETVSDTTLPPATAAALNQMRSDFATSMQNAGTANPESAAYRQRWRQSMIQSNEQFARMYGGEAFVRTQIQGVQASLGAKTGP